jgi:chromosome segregation ATPase
MKNENNIKKIVLYGVLAFVTVGLIGVYFSMEEEKEQLTEKSTQLEEELHMRDSAYNEIIDIMYGVESKIESIKQRENIISEVSNGDFNKRDKDQMIADMGMIDNLIVETNETVAKLVSKLDNANINLNSFKNRVNQLSKELDERKISIQTLREDLKTKDVQIAEMTADLNTLEYRVDVQESTIDMQINKINKQEDELSKAYFAIGTEKSLREDGLITKEGGFLWIGKTTELDENAAQEKFSEIDIRTTGRLIIDAEKINLVTEHPSDSYELIKEGNVIKYIDIKNPAEFWKISKYLVVVVKS